MGSSNVVELPHHDQTQPGFVKARPHCSQQSPRLAILTEGMVALVFRDHEPDSVTRSLKAAT